ncbi:MAG: M23 family metallopeptidase [Bacteroidia bacterium]|nr:M23 family metallopeptidase [Bacteroidia bacterium]
MHKFFRAMLCLCAMLAPALLRGSDTLEVKPNASQLIAALPEMNEPEVVLLLDSLMDCHSDTALRPLFAAIKLRVAELRSIKPEAVTGDFPAHHLYGSWDTRHLFAYPDSLYKADAQVLLSLGPFVAPVHGRITSGYGWRDSAMHRGIDIDLHRGDTVRAAFAGRVRFAARCGGYGNVVVVRHANGLETLYAHLWKISVKPGDELQAGAALGRGGSTGHSTGTHLHFELRFRGVAINPAWLLQLPELRLHESQVLLIRTREGFAVRPANCTHHTVQRGDSPYRIARRYGCTTAQLKSWNNWEKQPPLKAGQQVRIVAPGAQQQ